MNKIKLPVKKNEKGFSLVEVLLTLAIFSILIVLISYIIVINLRVSNIVNGRTKAREETSYLLKNLKKDIRNAESIGENNGNLSINIVPFSAQGGTTLEERVWVFDLGAMRVERNIDRGGESSVDFATPGDIEIRNFEYDLQQKPNNTIVIIRLQAWAPGMPADNVITKEVAVSTRVFEKD